MPATNEEFLTYLNQLIAATKNGKVKWVKENPTTYSWTTNNPQTARIVIQRIDRQRRVQNPFGGMETQTYAAYVFQVVNPSTGALKYSFGESSEADVQKGLAQLFVDVGQSVTQAGLDFLKSILPSP